MNYVNYFIHFDGKEVDGAAGFGIIELGTYGKHRLKLASRGFLGDIMQAARDEKFYTYDDYCTWDDDERWEIIDGAAYAMSPSPLRSHQSISGRLYTQLSNFLRGKTCEVFAAPFDVRLCADGDDGTVVQPDILVVCDQSKFDPDGRGVVGAPDLIIEILSPSTARHDLVTKFRLYQREGVREYWTVDPDRKTVAAHVLVNDWYVTRSYDDQDSSVPVQTLEGCTINLTDVFAGLI